MAQKKLCEKKHEFGRRSIDRANQRDYSSVSFSCDPASFAPKAGLASEQCSSAA